jgi:hypothetical protein
MAAVGLHHHWFLEPAYSPRPNYHIVADRSHRQEMSAFEQTKPDEHYKKGQYSARPERARISWGKSHAGSGSGGADLSYRARGGAT